MAHHKPRRSSSSWADRDTGLQLLLRYPRLVSPQGSLLFWARLHGRDSLAIPLHTGGPISVPPLARCNFPAGFVELHLSASTSSGHRILGSHYFQPSHFVKTTRSQATQTSPMGGSRTMGTGGCGGRWRHRLLSLGEARISVRSPYARMPYLRLRAVNEAQTLFHGSLYFQCEDEEGSLTDLDVMFAVKAGADGTPKTWSCEVLEGEAAVLNEGGGSEEMARKMAGGSRPWQQSSVTKGARIVMENKAYRGEMMAAYSMPSKHSVVIASLFLMPSCLTRRHVSCRRTTSHDHGPRSAGDSGRAGRTQSRVTYLGRS